MCTFVVAPHAAVPSHRSLSLARLLHLLLVALAFLGATATFAAETDKTFTAAECVRCHKIDPVFSHPVGMAAKSTVPAELPLDSGRITCITCHDNRENAHALAGATGTNLLRGDQAGLAFCTQCHDPLQLTRQAQHAFGVGQAHLRWPKQGFGTRALGAARPAGFLPPNDGSLLCLSCHDGTLARDSRGGAGMLASGPDQGHRVGVRYSDSSFSYDRRSDDMGLVPAIALNAKIRLFDGVVGCESCHSPYAGRKNLLVIDNRGSRLCLSCHGSR